MDTEVQTDREEPLTRAEVEFILAKTGGSDKLDLSGRNLEGTDLSGLELHEANLCRANLHRANLRGTELYGADMRDANLRGTDLRGADMRDADLRGADLRGTDLFGANLRGADLRGTDLLGVNLIGVDLSEVNPSETILQTFSLYEAAMRNEAAMRAVIEAMKGRDTKNSALTLVIRIVEEPLRAYDLASVLQALTHLHAKLWLIGQGRFSDLIEYVQMRDTRFTREANLTIGTLLHASPTLAELILNPATLGAASAAAVSLAGALKMIIDAIRQTHLRAEEKEIDIELKREERLLELEGKRIEIAGKAIEMMRPVADQELRGMLIQAIFPDLVQLGTVKVETALLLPHSGEKGIE